MTWAELTSTGLKRVKKVHCKGNFTMVALKAPGDEEHTILCRNHKANHKDYYMMGMYTNAHAEHIMAEAQI